MSRRLLCAGLLTLIAAALVVGGRFWPGRPAADALAASPPVAAAARESAAETAPEFPDKAPWAQGGPVRLGDLRGRVVVVHFWTNGCINCIHNYPVYRDWQRKYGKMDVTLVGVHTPEFTWEAPAERVRSKARENGLTFPVVLDRDNAIWTAWGNRYWPAIYLVDKRGVVRYRWEGELHPDTQEGRQFAAHIGELLAER